MSTLAVRNNNPLNIRAGQPWQGLLGENSGFAVFESPEYGYRAASRLLDTYQNKHGLNTLFEIINRWAPPSENDTSSYVNTVSSRLGIDPNQPIPNDPAFRQKLLKTMTDIEAGPGHGFDESAIMRGIELAQSVGPSPGSQTPMLSARDYDMPNPQVMGIPMGQQDQSIGGRIKSLLGMEEGWSPNYGLLGLGMGLVSGGGPSLQPTNAWASGLEGLMSGMQIDDRRAERQDRQAVIDSLSASDPTFAMLAQLDPNAAATYLANQNKPYDPTSLEQNLVAAGLEPGTPEFQQAVLSSITRPQSQVNVNLPGEVQQEATSKVFGENLAKAWQGAVDSGAAAQDSLASLQALETYLPQAYSGAFAGTVADLANMGQALGINIGDPSQLNASQAARAISNQLALQLRNPDAGLGMPGALSDRDLSFLRESVPRLENTPEGNALMIDYLKRVNQRKIDISNLAIDHARRNGGNILPAFFDEIQAYSEVNPLFGEDDATVVRSVPPAGAQAAVPDGVDPELWEEMTPEERALWQN